MHFCICHTLFNHRNVLDFITALALKQSFNIQKSIIDVLTLTEKIQMFVVLILLHRHRRFPQTVCLIICLSLPSVISLPSPIHQPRSLSLCMFLSLSLLLSPPPHSTAETIINYPYPSVLSFSQSSSIFSAHPAEWFLLVGCGPPNPVPVSHPANGS